MYKQEYLSDKSTKIYTRKELVMMETKNSDIHTSFYILAIQKLGFQLTLALFWCIFLYSYLMKIFVYTRNIFFVFQRNSTMSSTTSNDVINMKLYWGCSFRILIICFLVMKINTWTFGTAPQYTFPVWKCMIRLRICAHCSLCHIRCFGINMTPMWHHYVLICFLYVMWFLTRPFVLSILDLTFDFFQIRITLG